MAPIIYKMQQNRVWWLEYILRRDEAEAVNVDKNMYVEGKGERGRPKKRWIEVFKYDMKTT